MKLLQLKNVTKQFGGLMAVDNVSFDVKGQYFRPYRPLTGLVKHHIQPDNGHLQGNRR